MGDLEYARAEHARAVRTEEEARHQPKQLVDAVELQPRAEQAGEDLPGGNHPGDHLVGDRAAFEIGLQRLLPAHGERFVVPLRRAEVQHAVAQAAAQIGKQRLAAVAGQVHLGHKDHRGHMVVPQQLPKRPGVGLYAVQAADDQNGVVQHLQDPLRLGGEVHVPRRIEQGHRQIPVPHRRLACKDRDAPGALELVIVHGSVAVVHAALAFDAAGAI